MAQDPEVYIISSQGNFLTATASNDGTVAQVNTGFSVDDTENLSTASVQIDGTETDLSYQSDGTWRSADGQTKVTLERSLGEAAEEGEVYFLLLEQELGGVVSLYATADGFGKSDPRETGEATYSGSVEMHDPAGGTGNGTITLSMDFDAVTNGLSGSIAGGFPAEPTAEFTIAPTDVPEQSEKFESTIDSSDVTVVDSFIGGQFFGTEGSRMIGDFAIATSDASAVGFFDAAED